MVMQKWMSGNSCSGWRRDEAGGSGIPDVAVDSVGRTRRHISITRIVNHVTV